MTTGFDSSGTDAGPAPRGGQHAAPGQGGQGFASMARMCDYLLGDGHNFAIDRKLAHEFERAVPDIRHVVRLGRMFVRCAITDVIEAGIQQLLVIGSSVPLAGNAHAVARSLDPRCRVAYVDSDPVAVVHGQLLLGDDELTEVLHADPADADTVLAHETVAETLDLTAPVGLLIAGALETVAGAFDPASALPAYRAGLADGSYLMLSQLTADHRPNETAELVWIMNSCGNPARPRTRAEVAELFTGFELIGPGVVDMTEWYTERPLDPIEQYAAKQFYVGVGRKADTTCAGDEK